MTDDNSDALAGALAEYDQALSSGNFEAVSVLSTKIQALRGVHSLEPDPANAEADSEADLYRDLLPVDQALHDGKSRTFYLQGGTNVTGRVTDANIQVFTVTTRGGRIVWTVVRSAVVAIRLETAAKE